MLSATLLALAAAVLHAGWNLIAKRSVDPFVALWGLFVAAGALALPILAVGSAVGAGPSPAAWVWASVTGLVHVPYIVLLGRAYTAGDFSMAYPVARGGGALVATIGGVVVLGDRLAGWELAAIAVAVVGMSMLAVGAARNQVLVAVVVAVTVGTYTTIDSHAVRTSGGGLYVFAVYLMAALGISGAGLVLGKGPLLVESVRTSSGRIVLAAAMSVLTYGLVLIAVRSAPVGYVAALRESSVLIAALVGSRVLGEGHGRVRAAGAGLIVVGLVLLTAVSTSR